jgi:hypothetical protein
MKIRFISPSPKAGTEEHCENTAGRALVLAGFAVECPRIERGKPGWIEEQKEIESARTASAPPPVVQWAINPRRSDDQSAIRFIVAEIGLNGTIYYDSPPPWAPAHVKEKFTRMIAQDNADWTERQAFLKRQAAEPSTTTGYSETDVVRTVVIGGRRG